MQKNVTRSHYEITCGLYHVHSYVNVRKISVFHNTIFVIVATYSYRSC